MGRSLRRAIKQVGQTDAVAVLRHHLHVFCTETKQKENRLPMRQKWFQESRLTAAGAISRVGQARESDQPAVVAEARLPALNSRKHSEMINQNVCSKLIVHTASLRQGVYQR